MLIDDNIGCGTYNIAQVYNLPGQRSDSRNNFITKNMLTFTIREIVQEDF